MLFILIDCVCACVCVCVCVSKKKIKNFFFDKNLANEIQL
jgi:hypothetical protein